MQDYILLSEQCRMSRSNGQNNDGAAHPTWPTRTKNFPRFLDSTRLCATIRKASGKNLSYPDGKGGLFRWPSHQ